MSVPWNGLARIVMFTLVVMVGTSPAIADDDDCLGCHAVGEDVVDLEPHQQVDSELWMASIHAEMDFGCTDCHDTGDYEEVPHEDVEPALCANCHEDAQEAFETSVHADVDAFGVQSCTACHGTHDILAVDDPGARTFAENQPGTCGTCHGDDQVVGAVGLDSHLIANFQGSVHGLGLGGEGAQPAVCSDCHGAHDIKHAFDPDSLINPFRLDVTCGQCHEEISEQYRESVHGVAFAKGRTAAPTCTVCHGIHTIKHVPEPGATAHEAHLVRSTCIGCHSSEALMTGLDVPFDKVDSYKQSFHGLVTQRGGAEVADCASCHGIHDIRPSDDPKSRIHPANLQETCGDCHPRSTENFATTPVHYVSGDGIRDADFGVAVVEWVKFIYWILLFGVLGGMALHNIVILSWYVRRNWRRDRGESLRKRFSPAQVAQHAMLVTSFVVLVISGFTLAYPDTWWGRFVYEIGVSELARSWIHRGAAIVMIIASFIHAFWMFGSPYGRAELKRIAPGMRDVREVMQNMRFHLGASDRPAAFAKYDYPAKAEYWALVWGTIVMVVSGLILWFPGIATLVVPGWGMKVAEVVHLFEAWLATLAILIFHFFYVFAHPEIYPLNFSMFHGGMRKEMAEHHHPTWDEDKVSKSD